LGDKKIYSGRQGLLTIKVRALVWPEWPNFKQEDAGHTGIFKDDCCKSGPFRPNPADDPHFITGQRCKMLEVNDTTAHSAPRQ